MKNILLIDNYDSFTYNLYYYLQELGAKVDVVRNDKITIKEIENKIKNKEINYIVLSPGPCTPLESGICLDIIKNFFDIIPILGICLGHQAIGYCFGANIIKTTPVHGKIYDINHDGNSKIFKNIPLTFKATRYHSLIIENSSLSDDFIITATCCDNIIMAIEHKKYPLYGLQFHPESISSEFGHKMLDNFIELNK